jgi:hypothetical protein
MKCEASDVNVMPLCDKTAKPAADILREAFPWSYGGSEADKMR